MARKQQTKKVRKQFNPHKQARRLTGHLRVWTWQGQAQVEPPPFVKGMNKLNGSQIPVSQNELHILTRRPMDWIVGMRALCRAPDGVEYIESVTLTVRDFKLKELNNPDFNYGLLQVLMDGVKRDHLIDIGWMAHAFTGESWEHDCQRVADWITKDLGWLPIQAPVRKAAVLDFHAHAKEVWQELRNNQRTAA